MVDDLFIYACIVFASIANIVLKALGSMFIRDSHPFYVVVSLYLVLVMLALQKKFGGGFLLFFCFVLIV